MAKAAVRPARRFRVSRRLAPPGGAGRSYWPVTWSVPAALRATVVACGLLALCFKVTGSLRMALFATFGAFAARLTAHGGAAAGLPPELLVVLT